MTDYVSQIIKDWRQFLQENGEDINYPIKIKNKENKKVELKNLRQRPETNT